MVADALWYEAAYVVGITNALNVVADAFGTNGDSVNADAASATIEPVSETQAGSDVAAIFAEIRTFYARDTVPDVFRRLAHDPGYLADVWHAVRRAFGDNQLSRRLKEALAFAVSLTSRSRFGTAFHLGEMRRLGVGERGVMEVLGVTQMFSSYTKIADTLSLEPDMGTIAPIDPTPAPG